MPVSARACAGCGSQARWPGRAERPSSPAGGDADRHLQPHVPAAVHRLWVPVVQHHENPGDLQRLPAGRGGMCSFRSEPRVHMALVPRGLCGRLSPDRWPGRASACRSCSHVWPEQPRTRFCGTARCPCSCSDARAAPGLLRTGCSVSKFGPFCLVSQRTRTPLLHGFLGDSWPLLLP